MRTYTHGIIGYLLYYKGTAEQKSLAVIGAMIPDLFLAIGFLFHFSDNSIIEYFHDLFHFSFLHTLTEAMHSFVIIIPLLGLSYFFYKRTLPFFAGMFSHAIVDLLTHQRWAYNHFMPFPLEPIISPLAYTSLWFTVLEHILVLSFFVWFVYTRTKNHE